METPRSRRGPAAGGMPQLCCGKQSGEAGL
jgi:hypothetical protein